MSILDWGKSAPKRHGKPEQVEQEAIKKLLLAIGAKFYVAGTKRKRDDYQGTMQTPGLADLPLVFLPKFKRLAPDVRPSTAEAMRATEPMYQLVVIEMKSPEAHRKKGGGLSAEQKELKHYCDLAGIPYIHGDAKRVVQWLIEHGYLRAEQVATHWVQP